MKLTKKEFDITTFDATLAGLGMAYGSYAQAIMSKGKPLPSGSDFYDLNKKDIESRWSLKDRREFAKAYGIKLGERGLAKVGGERSGIHAERWEKLKANALASGMSESFFDSIEDQTPIPPKRSHVSVSGWFKTLQDVLTDGMQASGGQPRIVQRLNEDCTIREDASTGRWYLFSIHHKDSPIYLESKDDSGLKQAIESARESWGVKLTEPEPVAS